MRALPVQEAWSAAGSQVYNSLAQGRVAAAACALHWHSPLNTDSQSRTLSPALLCAPSPDPGWFLMQQITGRRNTVFTLMVSSGCPAKTRQTPPNPPAKKFFSGLIGCGCWDIFTFSSGRKTKQLRLNKITPDKKPRHAEELKTGKNLSPGRPRLRGVSLSPCHCCVLMDLSPNYWPGPLWMQHSVTVVRLRLVSGQKQNMPNMPLSAHSNICIKN